LPHLKRFYLEQNLTAKDQQTLVTKLFIGVLNWAAEQHLDLRAKARMFGFLLNVL
jgi:hypothetical protein